MTGSAFIFYLLSAVAVISAVMVVTRRNAVHSALFLVLTFFCVAGIYVVLAAEFLAAVQVLVYAGGIVVLYLFVIMLVPQHAPLKAPPMRHMVGALMLAGLLAGALITFFWDAPEVAPVPAAAATTPAGNIETVGMELYQRYLLPFEVASLLLLVAMIAPVILARRRI